MLGFLSAWRGDAAIRRTARRAAGAGDLRARGVHRGQERKDCVCEDLPAGSLAEYRGIAGQAEANSVDRTGLSNHKAHLSNAADRRLWTPKSFSNHKGHEGKALWEIGSARVLLRNSFRILGRIKAAGGPSTPISLSRANAKCSLRVTRLTTARLTMCFHTNRSSRDVLGPS